jgi:TonB family protein
MNGPAAAAAAQWRYRPTGQGAVVTMRTVEVPFRLDPEDAATQALQIGGGVLPPALIYKVAPEYSEQARQAKLQGTVLLSAIVEPSGKAVNIRVTQALGYGLDQQAIEAVEQWRFKPGSKDGAAVRVVATMQVNFRLL